MRCEFLAIFLNSGLVGTTSPPRSSVYLFCNLQSASTVQAIDVKILKYFKKIWKFVSKISVWICWNSYSSSQACLPLLQFCSLCLDTHRRPQILHNHCKLNTTIRKRCYTCNTQPLQAKHHIHKKMLYMYYTTTASLT